MAKPTTATATKKRAAPASKKVGAPSVPAAAAAQALQQGGKVATRVDKAQALRAVQALLQHHAKVIRGPDWNE